ncbi:MAG TPA: TIR domain-containing protein [Pyrinomonadaceae bacterium]
MAQLKIRPSAAANAAPAADAPRAAASAPREALSDTFISYSPSDQDLIRELDKAFRGNRQKLWIDWKDTPFAGDRRQEIFSRIEAAPNFIFVISPESVVSEQCLEELAQAVKLDKHLVPLLHREVAAEAKPLSLQGIEPLHFRRNDDFKSAFAALDDAIDTALKLDAFISYSRRDRTAHLWEMSEGRSLAELRAHTSGINDASFSRDGKYFVTAGDDSTARVWEVGTGHIVGQLRGHPAGVMRAAFSPDGRFIITGGAFGAANVYACEACRPVEELIAIARTRLAKETPRP